MNEEFHNTKGVKFADRESFNNAILLLTMIKSEYYYIVGFSRPKGIIRIAFDYETEYVSNITEIIEICFNHSGENIEITSDIANVDVSLTNGVLPQVKTNGSLSVINDNLIYRLNIKKDDIFPESIKDLNNYIQTAIKDIKNILQSCYVNSIK